MAEENLIFGLAQRHYQSLVDVFKRFPSINTVLIFGSRAKGTAKPHSDFDLAVIAPHMSDDEFSTLWSEITELPIIFKLDVLHWDRISNPQLKEKIIKEGKCFYKPD